MFCLTVNRHIEYCVGIWQIQFLSNADRHLTETVVENICREINNTPSIINIAVYTSSDIPGTFQRCFRSSMEKPTEYLKPRRHPRKISNQFCLQMCHRCSQRRFWSVVDIPATSQERRWNSFKTVLMQSRWHCWDVPETSSTSQEHRQNCTATVLKLFWCSHSDVSETSTTHLGCSRNVTVTASEQFQNCLSVKCRGVNPA